MSSLVPKIWRFLTNKSYRASVNDEASINFSVRMIVSFQCMGAIDRRRRRMEKGKW